MPASDEVVRQEERPSVRLGLVGFGEVGTAFAAGLGRNGLGPISAYDSGAISGQNAASLKARAAELGVKLVHSLRELAERSTLLLVVVPGTQSIAVARSLRPMLHADHVYVDLAAATPHVKQAVASILTSTKAQIADGAIMSTPSEDGYRVLILTSGPAARRFENLMKPWGMRITAIDGEMGEASGIKSLRSVFTKGLEAVLVECVLACHRYGIEEQVLASIADWMDQRPFMETLNLLLVTDAIHAGRRSREAAMSAKALRQAGLDPIMTSATAKLLRRNAALGLEQTLAGVIPERYNKVIAMMDSRLKGVAPRLIQGIDRTVEDPRLS
jgi:3-hydroxyisobutyrate dehydrogenase-like beta-hydroxyacid dehydrogenase